MSAATYELYSRLYDASLETVDVGDGSYKIRLSNALQTQIADHETRLDVLEAAAGSTGDITAVTAGAGLTGGGTSGAVSLAADFGTASGKVCQGNDSRLSDSRTPSGSAGGDLGGTYPNPTVTQARGLRETTGPTTLAMGAVADGEFLKRSGSSVIGGTPTSGKLLQRAIVTTTAALDTSTTIPLDNTIPQSGEGTAWAALNLTFTPVSASSTLEIELWMPAFAATAQANGVAAIFKDSDASAFAAGVTQAEAASRTRPWKVVGHLTPGSTTPIDFKVRVGPSTATTTNFGGSGLFGGVMATYLRVLEYAP